MTRVCTARRKDGQPCKGAAVTGSNVCRMHGARAGRPVLHGRYSQSLPTRLASRYAESLSDPQQVTIYRELALIDTRIEELIGRLSTTESAQTWSMALGVYRQMAQAHAEGDAEKAERLQEQLGAVLERGLGEEVQWAELLKQMDRRAKWVRIQGTLDNQKEKTYTERQVNAVMAAAVACIVRLVDDLPLRKRIADELAAIADRPASG